MLAREVIILKKKKILKDRVWHARIQKIFPGWEEGGGPNSQKGSGKENFNMAKTNNLAIPGGGGGMAGPPVPPSGSAHVWTVNIIEIICINKWN